LRQIRAWVETNNEIEFVDDKPKTIAKESQRKLDEKTRYVKDPTEPVDRSVLSFH
jgi:hypothetical protein